MYLGLGSFPGINVRPALQCIRVLVPFFLPRYVALTYVQFIVMSVFYKLIIFLFSSQHQPKDGVAPLSPWHHPPSLQTLHTLLHPLLVFLVSQHCIVYHLIWYPHKITPGGQHLILSLSPAPTSHQGKFLFELFKICFWIFQIYFAVWLLFIPFAFCLSRLLLTHKKVGLFLNADAFWREKLTLVISAMP